MIQKWGIDHPDEAAGLSDAALAQEAQAALDHGVASPLAWAVFKEMRARFDRWRPDAEDGEREYAAHFPETFDPDSEWELRRGLDEHGANALVHFVRSRARLRGVEPRGEVLRRGVIRGTWEPIPCDEGVEGPGA